MKLLYFIIVCTLVCGETILFASTDLGAPLQNEQQRQIYEKLQNIDTTIPSIPLAPKETNISQDQNDSVCFVSRSIVLHNASLLSDKEIQTLSAPYVGRCNGIKSLSALANILTNHYIDKGYITSRVYLIPQDISDGEIDFYALEGKVNVITPEEIKSKGSFIGMSGEPLRLSDIETAIEQMNRLRSNQTTMTLRPAERSGYSDIELTSKEGKPFFGSLGTNNYGSAATGKYQLYGGFVWENFLGVSDILSINLNTTDKHQEGRKSFGNSYTYSVPLGKWLWEAGFSRFTYDQTIYGLNNNYISHGESAVSSLQGIYKLFHNRSQNLEVSAQLAQKRNKSLIDGAQINSSTYDLTVENLGIKHVYRQSSWELYTLLNYIHGLNALNPTTDGKLKNDFTKWILSMGGTKYLPTTLPMRYTLSAYAQYSEDLLYSVEQISIGGAYSVRGFQKQGLIGNRGWYARNDLLFDANEYFSPYIAIDVGQISSTVDVIGGRLVSSSVGLRGHYKAFALDVYGATPLKHPNENFYIHPFIGMSLSANF